MKTTITMQPVVSSQLAAIGHCAETNTLAIEFIGKNGPGSLYHYQNFTAADFAAFAGAESVGKHFYARIKPFAEQFPYERIEQTDDDRARLQSIADARALPSNVSELMASNLPRPEAVTVRDAFIDAGIDDPEVTDAEIAAMGAECGMTPDAWIARLEAFCVKMRVTTSTGQRYSKTTFKDNGEPILLNADGSRSIFCDVDD